jgi:hypothetical protein
MPRARNSAAVAAPWSKGLRVFAFKT